MILSYKINFNELNQSYDKYILYNNDKKYIFTQEELIKFINI